MPQTSFDKQKTDPYWEASQVHGEFSQFVNLQDGKGKPRSCSTLFYCTFINFAGGSVVSSKTFSTTKNLVTVEFYPDVLYDLDVH